MDFYDMLEAQETPVVSVRDWKIYILNGQYTVWNKDRYCIVEKTLSPAVSFILESEVHKERQAERNCSDS